MSTKTITINPITRLEGHGKIEIFLNEEGNVENAYFQVPELDRSIDRVEMAFRAYDPCLACATHFAVGQMPLQVSIYNHNKKLVKTLER